MSSVVRFLKSSIGAKTIMALSGFGVVLFVAQHMVANVLIFAGRESFNAYAYNIKHTPLLVWGGRGGLIVALGVHIWSGLRLSQLNKAARPVAYAMKKPVKATLASRTMLLSGLVVAAFLAYHLAHFTWGLTNPSHFHLKDELGHHDAYSMVILGFQQPLISLTYTISMILVGLHLSHGVSSMFQSLGWNSAKWRPLISKIGPVFAVVVVAGFLTIPAAILLGLISLPAGVSP